MTRRQEQDTVELFAERSDGADIEAARRLPKRSGDKPPHPRDRR